MRRVGLIVLGVLLLAADLCSKFWVQGHLPQIGKVGLYPYGGIGIFQNIFGVQFSIVHHTNTGAVWGIFAGYPHSLLILRLALVAAMVVYLIAFNRDRRLQIPMVMIIAGALGNVLDIFLYGHVVDLFYFILWGWHYPVFNLADATIFCGVAAIVLQSFLPRKRIRRAGL